MKPIVLTVVDSEDLILETDTNKQLALTGVKKREMKRK